jgi:hypothetical protein
MISGKIAPLGPVGEAGKGRCGLRTHHAI